MSFLISPNALWLEGGLQCVFLVLLLTLALALTSALCLALPLAFVVALQNWSGGLWADRQTGRLFRQTGRQADRGTDGHKDGRPRNGWSEGLRTDDGQNDNERQDGQGFMTRRSVRSLNTQSASFHRYC